jgi:glycine C-acetyltransferase
MLRLIPTAVHTLEDVDVTIAAFEEVAVKLKDGAYAGEAIAVPDMRNV